MNFHDLVLFSRTPYIDSKNNHFPQGAVFEKFVSPAEGRGEDSEITFTTFWSMTYFFQPIKFVNLKIDQICFLNNQQIVIDYICMEIIYHNKSIAKIWLIIQNTWMEIKLY